MMRNLKQVAIANPSANIIPVTSNIKSIWLQLHCSSQLLKTQLIYKARSRTCTVYIPYSGLFSLGANFPEC